MKCSLLTLSSYLDGELDAARLAEVEAHLVGCDRCRAGLEYLREETERFGALGRVHVPDAAVPGFLQQLGLIGPDDILPPRPPRPPDPPGPPGGGVTP
ncbi:MAG: zf-HC2 domain-containing protein, partial [Candidatus Dormiibacterota bacterium]